MSKNRDKHKYTTVTFRVGVDILSHKVTTHTHLVPNKNNKDDNSITSSR
jgi:hypothetical protein